MPQFSANIGFLWPELTLTERIHAAKAAGFLAVECHWPYETNPIEMRQALRQTGLQMLALNTDTGDLEIGEYGFGAVPGRENDARASIDKAVEYAKIAGIKYVHLLAGTAGDSEEAMCAYYDNLLYASRATARHQIGVIIEPINRIDRPGYTLDTVDRAIAVIEKLRANDQGENVGIMFDCYHVQTTEGFLCERLKRALPYVVHIQIAAVPGRGEPDHGEINYPWLFQQIDDLGYQRYIGAEYIPTSTTNESLNWFQPFRGCSKLTLAGEPVYKSLNQTQLDNEYNNLEKVADSAVHLQWFHDHSKEVRGTTVRECDLSFGSHPDEVLDIFFPNGTKTGNGKRPVHVFFHGGYWRALHKDDFSYVANVFKNSDALCVVVNYSLVPDVTLTQLVDQCRKSLVWIWNNIGQYGGDKNNISISGHSAGGQLVGMMMATDWPLYELNCPTNLVKAGVSVSGIFDLQPIQASFLNQTLQLDQSAVMENSPIQFNNRSHAELICYYGNLEGAEYRNQSESISSKWTRTYTEALYDHNHFTIVRELDQPDSQISINIRRQLGIEH